MPMRMALTEMTLMKTVLVSMVLIKMILVKANNSNLLGIHADSPFLPLGRDYPELAQLEVYQCVPHDPTATI